MSGESAPKPVKPRGLDTPGMAYRHRPSQDRWHLIWSPRSDLVARGYPKTTHRLWPPTGITPPPLEPTPEEWEGISAWCVRYQAEMNTWANGGVSDDPLSVFNGTIKSLIRLYQTDPDSPFRKLRHRQQIRYACLLRTLEDALGRVAIKSITFRDIDKWHNGFAEPETPGGRRMLPRAYALMQILRLVCAFGKLVLPKTSGCADVCQIFADRKDAGKVLAGGRRKRKEFLTYQQVAAVCSEARRRGFASIGLAQAMQFEGGLRQKDVIGEWVPHSEPGLTDVVTGKCKWLMGARWEEIDEHFVWTHRLSKSVKGQDGIMDAEAGKTEAFDLRAYPMVMEELRCLQENGSVVSAETQWDSSRTNFTTGGIPAVPTLASERCETLKPQNETLLTGASMKTWVGDRAAFPASGPVIVSERTGRPWTSAKFGREWRKIARAAGIPDAVQNRDSRSGAATEADLAGGAREHVQRVLAHSSEATTAGYQRANLEIRNQIAQLRAEKRK